MINNSFAISTHCLAGVTPAVHMPLFRRYGFSSVELNLGYWPLLTDDAGFEQLKKMIHDCGISVWAYHMPYGSQFADAGNVDPSHPDAAVREATVRAVARGLERLADLGGKRLIVHPNVMHLQPDQRARAMALCRETLKVCSGVLEALRARRAEAGDILLAVEPMPPWGLLNHADEVESLFDELDRRLVGLCLDVNHINLGGQDPLKYVKTVAGFVCTTHLSDNDGLDERHWAPGRGRLPWTELLAALTSCGYSGPMIFETGQFGNDAEDTVAQLACLREKLRTASAVC